MGSALEAAPPKSISPADLTMLMRSIEAFAPEFPPLELGEVSARASRLLQWKTQVEQLILPAGPLLLQWWRWCQSEAERSHKLFVQTPIHQREAIIPTASMPEAWGQIEAWVRPRVANTLPQDIKHWVVARARQGTVDPTHVLRFYLLQSVSPGGADEQVLLHSQSLNPNACRQARASQLELMRWKTNLRRSS